MLHYTLKTSLNNKLNISLVSTSKALQSYTIGRTMDIKLQYNDYTFTIEPEYTYEPVLMMGGKYMKPQLDSFTLLLLDDKDGAVTLEQEYKLVNEYYDKIMNDLQDMFDDGLLDAEAERLC